MYFHDKVQSNKSLAEAYQLALSLNSNGTFQTVSDADSTRHAKPAIMDSLERVFIPGANCHLTLREYDCLSWLAKGKTQDQIAEILNISHRTVKAYVLSAREKLDCTNQFQLGMMFSKIGLI